MKQKEIIQDRNIFRIFKNHKGEQTIKILGYFYEGDDCWKHVEFGGFEMPLEEWVKADENTKDIWESETKQYITDMSEDEALAAFLSYAAKSISHAEMDENTPEGIYI